MALTLQHLTLTTGDLRESPRSEVSDAVIAALRPIVDAGGGDLPQCCGWRVEIQSHERGVRVMQIHGPPGPCVWGMLCMERDDRAIAWHTCAWLMEQASLARRPHCPTREPWLAVLLLEPIARVRREDVAWLGDAERCIAWTCWETPPPELRIVEAALPETIPSIESCPVSWATLTRAQQYVAAGVIGFAAPRAAVERALALRTSPWAHWVRSQFPGEGPAAAWIWERLRRRNRTD